MKSFAKSRAADEVEYPSSDGKPMAETEFHLNNMFELIRELKGYFSVVNDVYVCGNMLMYYVPGNKRKHVSPDVFVVRGIDKRIRENYLVWEEGKAPDLVIELTSTSTKHEDLETKFKLYRDVLKVHEYFLFDPQSAYLTPSMQGYRLLGGHYSVIHPVNGRLPSKVLGLHLERSETALRLFDPACGKWLPTESETLQQAALARQKAEEGLEQETLARQETEEGLQQETLARREAEAGLQQETLARQKAEASLHEAEAELEMLRRKLAARPEENGP